MFQRFIAPAVLFQSFKVSLLRCFRVSKFHRTCGAVSKFQSFSASLFQSFKVSLLRCSEFHRTCGAVSEFQVSPLRCFRVSSHLWCCFKVPGFTASLFQCFITPPPSGTQNKRLIYLGRAEVRVAFNFPLWVPKSKPRLRLFAFGRAET